MVDARFSTGKAGSGDKTSHNKAKILVFFVLVIAVAVMAMLGKDIMNIGGENKEILTSEIIFSGEISRDELKLSKKELRLLEKIERTCGKVFKHVMINAEKYTGNKNRVSDPGTQLIFWLEIKTRNGKVLKPMRIKSTRRDFMEKLARGVEEERESLTVAARHEASTRKKIKAVHGN